MRHSAAWSWADHSLASHCSQPSPMLANNRGELGEEHGHAVATQQRVLSEGTATLTAHPSCAVQRYATTKPIYNMEEEGQCLAHISPLGYVCF